MQRIAFWIALPVLSCSLCAQTAPLHPDTRAGSPEQSARPGFLRRALVDMRRTNRAGLIFAVPEGDEARRRLAKFLWIQILSEIHFRASSKNHVFRHRRLRTDSSRHLACRLCSIAIPICVPRQLAIELYGIRPEQTVLLLDPTGKRLAARGYVPSLSELLQWVQGGRFQHLKRIASIGREKLTFEELDRWKTCLAGLRVGSHEMRVEALARDRSLRRFARRAAATMLFDMRDETRALVRRRFRRFLDLVIAPSRRLDTVYGLELPREIDFKAKDRSILAKAHRNVRFSF